MKRGGPGKGGGQDTLTPPPLWTRLCLDMCKPKLLFSNMAIVTEPTEKLIKKVLLSLITCLGGGTNQPQVVSSE